ncbi:MAG TPA: FkbM family methyltransferase [Bacteroidales bacterium]|nr:FkbM family methyltransferase [Bacteroidales bacterium]
MDLRSLLKLLLFKFQIPATDNIRYDIYTKKIMQQVLRKDTNTLDIGCHKGEILDEILMYAPDGIHYAFEPLPHLFADLQKKYYQPAVHLSDIALFDKKGTTSFQYVINDPAYSGIRKRKYNKEVQITELTVKTDLLDNVIPDDVKIGFIKIDVEGAEYPVLKGGIESIRRSRPIIIFECGLGAADYYGTKPEEMYGLLSSDCGLRIRTMKGFLKNHPALTEKEFSKLFSTGGEYYFIASPDQDL